MWRAIVSANEGFYRQVFKELANQDDWDICYWLTIEDEIGLVKAMFPTALVTALENINFGRVSDHAHSPSLPPVDDALLSELRWCEPLVLEMMDRMDPEKRLRYDDRLRLYHFYVRYWSAIIGKLCPNIFFASSAPHEVADFVLFALCKKLGIQTIMFEWTSLPGLSLLIEDYRGIPKDLEATYSKLQKEASLPVLSRTTAAYIEKSQSDYQNAMPGYFRASRTEAQSANKFRLKHAAKRLVRIFTALPNLAKKVSDPLNHLYSQGNLPNRCFLPAPTMLERCLQNKRTSQSFSAAQALYNGLCVKPDYSIPYIYFALHFQPERSTCPSGGVFSDQRLAINILANCLPKGWILYVKEHPSQFIASRYGHVSRSCAFYLDISAHENVRFIKQDAPQFELIDNSRAVATITGTSGWEALIRGKQALIFGEAWYQACLGAHRIRIREDCNAAILSIIHSPTSSDSAVRKFVAAIESTAHRIYFNAEHASWDSEPFDEHKNVSACKTVIENFLKSRSIVVPKFETEPPRLWWRLVGLS
jgi:hypothetical protein